MTDASVAAASQAGGSPTTLRRIARLLAPYRDKMLLVGLAVVVSALLATAAPFLTKAVFDSALFPTDGRPADFRLLAWLVAGLCAIPVATALIGIGQNLLTSTIGNSAMADLRGDLFAHLQKMELAFFTATRIIFALYGASSRAIRERELSRALRASVMDASLCSHSPPG